MQNPAVAGDMLHRLDPAILRKGQIDGDVLVIQYTGGRHHEFRDFDHVIRLAELPFRTGRFNAQQGIFQSLSPRRPGIYPVHQGLHFRS